MNNPASQPLLQTSGTYTAEVMQGIHTKAETGIYEIRGYGTLRQRRWATFDDLTFLPCGLTRIPLEGYREKCSTRTVLGGRFAKRPLELEIPIMITGMSWGALSYNAKAALAKAAAKVGTSNTTGDGGLSPAEREFAKDYVYEVLPSRYGIDVHDLRGASAIELTIGQGAKPGTGGLLLGSKISETIAHQRDLPVGVDQRSPARHPDML
jgi:glutamate synthase domain-containing protein 2